MEGRRPRWPHRDLRRGSRDVQAVRAPERGHRPADAGAIEGQDGRQGAGVITRILAVLLSVLVLAPSGALAQQSRAGVVTTLEGNVSARRVALPGPVPLKFQADLFLQATVP